MIATQLSQFADEVVPRLTKPIVLVSGCDDLGPKQALVADQLRVITESSKVLAWFAQNCDYVHPKLRPLPIGIDFHTLDPNRGTDVKSWGPRRCPLRQDELLRRLAEDGP